MLRRYYLRWLKRRLLRVLKGLDDEWLVFLNWVGKQYNPPDNLAVLSERNGRQRHSLDMAMVVLHELSKERAEDKWETMPYEQKLPPVPSDEELQ